MAGLIVDGVLILIIIIFAIVGYRKGLLRSVISLLGTTGAIVVAFLTKDYVAQLITRVFGLNTLIADKIMSQVGALSPAFVDTVCDTSADMKTVINNSQVGVVYKKLFTVAVKDEIQPATVSEYIGAYVANLAMLVMAFLIIFLLVKVVVYVLDKGLKRIPRRSVIGRTNGFLGVISGLVMGAVYVVSILGIVYFLCLIPSVNEFLLPYIESTFITKALYQSIGAWLFV